MSNHASMHAEWEPAQNIFSLKTFLSEAYEDDKRQLVIRHPNIIEIIEGDNTITSSLTSRLSRNMRMFAETYVKDNQYLWKEASLPELAPKGILEIVNCS